MAEEKFIKCEEVMLSFKSQYPPKLENLNILLDFLYCGLFDEILEAKD